MTRPQDPLQGDLALRLAETGGGTSLPPPAEMLAALDDPERARAARMNDSSGRAAFIAGRYVQRLLVADLLEVHPLRLTSWSTCPSCGASDHGRPGYSLGGKAVPLALSLSRAAGFVLVAALGRSGSAGGVGLGVDLEAVQATGFDGFDDVALTAAERRSVDGSPAHSRAEARTRLWARKEALVKAHGTGFADRGPDTLDVLQDRRIEDVADVGGILLRPKGLVAAVAVVGAREHDPLP